MPWLGSFDVTHRIPVPVNGTLTLSPATFENDSVCW